MRFLIEKQGSEVPSQAYVLQTGSGELSVVQVGNQDPTKVCEGCFRWHFYVCVCSTRQTGLFAILELCQ